MRDSFTYLQFYILGPRRQRPAHHSAFSESKERSLSHHVGRQRALDSTSAEVLEGLDAPHQEVHKARPKRCASHALFFFLGSWLPSCGALVGCTGFADTPRNSCLCLYGFHYRLADLDGARGDCETGKRMESERRGNGGVQRKKSSLPKRGWVRLCGLSRDVDGLVSAPRPLL